MPEKIGKSPFIDPLLRKGMVGKNAFAHDFVCMMYYTYKEPPYLLVQAPLAYGDIILMLPPNRRSNFLGRYLRCTSPQVAALTNFLEGP